MMATSNAARIANDSPFVPAAVAAVRGKPDAPAWTKRLMVFR